MFDRDWETQKLKQKIKRKTPIQHFTKGIQQITINNPTTITTNQIKEKTKSNNIRTNKRKKEKEKGEQKMSEEYTEINIPSFDKIIKAFKKNKNKERKANDEVTIKKYTITEKEIKEEYQIKGKITEMRIDKENNLNITTMEEKR